MWDLANRERSCSSSDGEIRSLQWSDMLFDYGVWSFDHCFHVWQEAKQAHAYMHEYCVHFHTSREGTGMLQ
jgi:hypothetical protein